MNEKPLSECCSIKDSLVLIQAIPLCQFDQRKRMIIDDYLNSLEKESAFERSDGLPAASVLTMPCSDAVEFVKKHGGGRIAPCER